jgi:hypothetical protein
LSMKKIVSFFALAAALVVLAFTFHSPPSAAQIGAARSIQFLGARATPPSFCTQRGAVVYLDSATKLPKICTQSGAGGVWTQFGFNLVTESPSAGVQLDRTITPIGTTGNQTINKIAGTVNVAAGASSVTVTNSLVTASSIIIPAPRTNDTTCAFKNYVADAGTFTINMTANCTAATSVGFVVTN